MEVRSYGTDGVIGYFTFINIGTKKRKEGVRNKEVTKKFIKALKTPDDLKERTMDILRTVVKK